MSTQPQTWAQRWDAFTRNHPLVYLLLVLALAFLVGPLMIGATSISAVLYKGF